MTTYTTQELNKFQSIVDSLNQKNGTDFTIEDMLACVPKLDAIAQKELNKVVIDNNVYTIFSSNNKHERIRSGKGYTKEELQLLNGSTNIIENNNELLIIRLSYCNITYCYKSFASGYVKNKSGKYVSSCQVEGFGHYDLLDGSYYMDKTTFEQKYN